MATMRGTFTGSILTPHAQDPHVAFGTSGDIGRSVSIAEGPSIREIASVPTASLSAQRLVGIVALAVGLTIASWPASAVASTHMVAVKNFQFAPASVSVSVGDTVSWTFSGAPHTVTSGAPGAPDGQFDSGVVNAGGTFAATFSTPGAYPYFCGVHPAQMSGTVVVAALPGGTPTPGPTPRPTPRATATSTPTPGPTPRPSPRAIATSSPTPTVPPTPSPTPSPAATPTGGPSPTATPSPSRASSAAPPPAATSTAGPSPVDAGGAGGSLPAVIVGLGLLILLAGGALVRARRRRP